jgi:prophage regulatory protein
MVTSKVTLNQINERQRIIRWPEVEARVGFSKSYIYALQARGLFPKPIKLRPGGRAIGYIESEIDAYIRTRITESRSGESL